MNEHAIDAMIYAWRVMKEKEENKMEGIFLGKIDLATFDPRSISLSFRTKHLDQHVEVRKELDYDRDYVLVKADDVITTNDELLKLREKVEKLEAELMESKTARTLREAYITGVEKGCESLREERDRWKSRCNSVMTDISKSLAANGIEFKLKENDGEATWVFVIDIPELNEAKKKVEDLEKQLKDAKFHETFWRDRKEEEEKYRHYWHYTFCRAKKQAADKGVYIAVAGEDKDCNASVVVVDNMKAEELERQIRRLEDDNSAKAKAVVAAKDRGDYYKGESDAIARNYCNLKKNQEKKWQAMLDALKDKGVEVVYMGEQDGKPIVDVEIPEIDILKKELEALKSRTLDNVEIRLSCGDIVWTYCDGFSYVSSGISGMISADEISTGTVPKCSSCAHYMHNPSRFTHDWCHIPVSKEGPGYIRKLSKEEAEGPACSDFKKKE